MRYALLAALLVAGPAAAQTAPQPPVTLLAAAAILALVWLTGATGGFHLDGVADTADGLGSRRDPARALEIMKQSDIGPMGVIALVLTLLVDLGPLGQLVPDERRANSHRLAALAALLGLLAPEAVRAAAAPERGVSSSSSSSSSSEATAAMTPSSSSAGTTRPALVDAGLVSTTTGSTSTTGAT